MPDGLAGVRADAAHDARVGGRLSDQRPGGRRAAGYVARDRSCAQAGVRAFRGRGIGVVGEYVRRGQQQDLKALLLLLLESEKHS